MRRQVACAAGTMLLAGLGGWTSEAFSQGAMTPRPDVAPAPRVAPSAPQPTIVTPAPVTPAPQTIVTPRPAGAPPPYVSPALATPAAPTGTSSTGPNDPATPFGFTDRNGYGIYIIGAVVLGLATNTTTGETMQLRTDTNGGCTLPPGDYELMLSGNSLQPGPTTGAGPSAPAQPAVLVGLLLPAVQKLGAGGAMSSPLKIVERKYDRVIPGQSVRIKITMPKDGSGTLVDWGDGSPPVNVARSGTTPASNPNGTGTVAQVGLIPR